MRQRIEKPELVALVAKRTSRDPALVAEIADGLLEEIYAALKRGESISLRNFGSFFIRGSNTGRVFKFNPSQRLRALFGWSSTYHGDI
jgi:DNA-binding protein HU-beta